MTPEQIEALLEEASKVQTAPREKTTGERINEFLFGDDDPNTQNLGERIGSTLNKAGEAMTFGLIGDEASAAVESVIPGVNYEDRRDHYRQQEEVLERDNPGLALGAEIGGSLAGALMPMGAMGTLGRGAGLVPRIAASSAAGAAGAGTYGFMEGEEGIDDRLEAGADAAKFGAAVGAVVPAAGAAVQKGVGGAARNRIISRILREATDTNGLRAMGDEAYRAVDDANVQIRPEAFGRLRNELAEALRRQGLDELPGPGSLTPKASRVMQIADSMGAEMAPEPTAGLPFSSLDQLRRHAGTAAADVASGRPTPDARLGSEAISRIDDFVANLGPDDVLAGDLETLQTAIPKARDLWARMSRSRMIDDAVDASEDYLSGKASGIRNQFRRILRNPKLSRGFSDEEKRVLRRVINGSPAQQLLNLLGSGIGQLGQMGVGFSVGSVPGAAAGMASSAMSRKLSEVMTERGAEQARALIGSGQLQSLQPQSDTLRRITESLLRRTGAVSPQN